MEKLNLFSQKNYVIAILLAIVSIVFYLNYTAVFDEKIDMNGDNIYYYSLAKSLHEGQGYSNTMGFETTPHNHFPPGYPAFASCIMKFFGDDIITIKKANGWLMYGSVILLFFVAFLISKNSILGFCAAILTSMHSEMLRMASLMMSETLFIFLSLLAVFLALLLSRWTLEKRKWWLLAILAVLLAGTCAFAYFTRTIGLSVILAIAGWAGILALISLIKWLKARKAEETENITTHRFQFIVRVGIVAVVMLGTGVAKMSWDKRNADLGFTNNDYMSTFGMKTNNEKMEGREDWVKRIEFNTSHFIGHWIPTAVFFKESISTEEEMKSKISGKEWFYGLLLLGTMVLGSCLGLEQMLLLFYIIITLGVLTLYPEQYGGTRYIEPIEPVFILLFLNGICAAIALILKLLKSPKPTFILQAIALLIVTFVIISPKYTAAQTNNRNLAKIKSWITGYDIPKDSYLKACQWCGDSIPSTARVVCRKPELFYMFSKCHKSEMFPRYGEPDAILDYFIKNKIDYVIMDTWFKHAYATIWPCIQKYPDKFKPVKMLNQYDEVNKINPTYVMQFNNEWGYEGDLVNGVREGKGVWKMNDGRVYEGEFSNNLPNGYGEITTPDGVTAKGIWKDGNLVDFQGQYKKE